MEVLVIGLLIVLLIAVAVDSEEKSDFYMLIQGLLIVVPEGMFWAYSGFVWW